MGKPETITYKLLLKNQSEKKKYSVTLFHKKFIVYPGVFSPKYFNDTQLFAKYLPVKKGSTILEIGTGTGIISIVAAFKGARYVIGTDINPIAIKNARANVRSYHLHKKIKIIQSNLFAKVPRQQFDLIFFNLPFCFTTKRQLSMLEKALFDYSYKTVTRFIRNCGLYIKNNGKILVGFSSFFGDLRLLRKIAARSGYKLRVIKNIQTRRNGYAIRLQILQLLKL